jgi:hypothetical protein
MKKIGSHYWKLIFILTLCWQLSTLNNPAFANQASQEVQSRLSQIFYWHLADELKISAEQEREMIRILEDVQKQRSHALNERELALINLKKLDKSSNVKASSEVLTSYIKAVEKLSVLDREEFERLRRVLGDGAFAKFLIVRDEVTDRIRNSIRKSPASKQ